MKPGRYLDLLFLHSAAVFQKFGSLDSGAAFGQKSSAELFYGYPRDAFAYSLLRRAKQCSQSPVMSKTLRDDQITLRLSRTLRAALEDEAIADGERGLSGVIRKILVDHATKRIADRASASI